MKKLLKTTGGKLLALALALLMLLVMSLGGYTLWHFLQPKFHAVTIELGSPLPAVAEFMTEMADLEKVRLVTPVETIDLTRAGTVELTFTHGWKKETVVLTIEDTTAPAVTFQAVTADIGTKLYPEDFIAELSDMSSTAVSFVTQPAIPDSYGDATVEVVVTDASGNQVKGSCFVYYVWMRKTYTLEVGDTLEKADLLLSPEKDDALLDQAELDAINASGVGVYTITSTDGQMTSQCVITVQDTIAPALELKPVQIDRYESVKMEDFIVSVSDAAGEVTTKLLTKLDNRTVGAQTVTIEATDINGNVTTLDTTLVVHKDTKAPTISGVGNMTLEKNATVDFREGVSAWDVQDGQVEFTCDTSRVNLAAAGTYYVIYTATDSNGNTSTMRRKVVVNHDAADTAALVQSIAAKLGSGVETLRNYVRGNLGYSSDWGGDDPVWYGFKEKKTGNCYVHALCLQALLDAKGYENMLIWTTDKSHYWNLVKINGEWKHIDSTPGDAHSHYSIMNDKQRKETLSWYRDRDWDRTQWPACP